MKQVIYRSPFIPSEWIAAHGLSPLRLMPSSSSITGPIPDSEGTCPFMREFINEADSLQPAGIILTTMCDQMRRGYELLERSSSSNCFLFNLPSTWQTSSSCTLYISELERLCDFLVSIGGEKPTHNKLIEVMINYNETRITEASKPKPASDGIPVALIGGAISKADKSLLDIIVSMGGRIVFDGSEMGERCSPAPFDLQDLHNNYMNALTESYLLTIPDAFKRPDSQLYLWLQNKCQKHQPRGIIFLRQVWCDIWHAEVQRTREWLGIPMLDLDLNGKDPIPRDIMRIEAFLEAIR